MGSFTMSRAEMLALLRELDQTADDAEHEKIAAAIAWLTDESNAEKCCGMNPCHVEDGTWVLR